MFLLLLVVSENKSDSVYGTLSNCVFELYLFEPKNVKMKQNSNYEILLKWK